MKFDPPGVGGRLVEIQDPTTGEGWEVGRISAWEPGRRLRFEWRLRNFRPGETTEVEVLFEAVADGTRITLHHRGWAALPWQHPARHGLDEPAWSHMRGGAWADLLAALRLRVAAQGPAGRRNRRQDMDETR